jgi:hypothetical protein
MKNIKKFNFFLKILLKPKNKHTPFSMLESSLEQVLYIIFIKTIYIILV